MKTKKMLNFEKIFGIEEGVKSDLRKVACFYWKGCPKIVSIQDSCSAFRECFTFWETHIHFSLFWEGQLKKAFEFLGGHSIKSLLYHFP